MFPKRALLFSRQCELKGLVCYSHHAPQSGGLYVWGLSSLAHDRLGGWRRTGEEMCTFSSYQAPRVPPVCSGRSLVSCSTLHASWDVCQAGSSTTSLCPQTPFICEWGEMSHFPVVGVWKTVERWECRSSWLGGEEVCFGWQYKHEVKVIKWSSGCPQIHCFHVSTNGSLSLKF